MSWCSRWVSWVARVVFVERRDWRWVDEDVSDGWDVDGAWTRECWRSGEVRIWWRSVVLGIFSCVCCIGYMRRTVCLLQCPEASFDLVVGAVILLPPEVFQLPAYHAGSLMEVEVVLEGQL